MSTELYHDLPLPHAVTLGYLSNVFASNLRWGPGRYSGWLGVVLLNYIFKLCHGSTDLDNKLNLFLQIQIKH